WPSLSAVAQTPPLTLVTAVAVGLGMLVLPRLTRHYLLLPGIMFGGVALFYAGFAVSGLTVEAARAQGMVFAPLQAAASPLPPLELLDEVHWDLVLGQLNHLLAISVVVVIGVSLS